MEKPTYTKIGLLNLIVWNRESEIRIWTFPHTLRLAISLSDIGVFNVISSWGKFENLIGIQVKLNITDLDYEIWIWSAIWTWLCLTLIRKDSTAARTLPSFYSPRMTMRVGQSQTIEKNKMQTETGKKLERCALLYNHDTCNMTFTLLTLTGDPIPV